jgi:UDP-glucose 4-epimerase
MRCARKQRAMSGRPNRSVLVTGASGTIGRHVARAFAARGCTVAGIGRGDWSPGQQAAWGLSSWRPGEVDLENLSAFACVPDVIVHCAGSGAVGASFAAPHVDFQCNVATTAAVLEFMRIRCPNATLVFPSSAAVYGMAEELPTQERAPLRPVSPYGLHKKLAEEMVAHYAATFGFAASVVRLFSIYGEGFRKQLLWDACHRISDGHVEFFGTGEESRDWLHVEDTAALLAQAAVHATRDCPVANGASGERVSVRLILTELFRLMGRQDTPRFRGEARPGDPQHYHADIARARAWGWQPAIPWQDGLRRYVEWYRRECGPE